VNAHVERWVGSVRRQCLDRLLIFSRRQLERVLRVYGHYNEQRPHRALDLQAPDPRTTPPTRGQPAGSAMTPDRGMVAASADWTRSDQRSPSGPRELAYQMETYFSIIERKALTPNDYDDVAALARTLDQFERRWNEVAKPFERNSTSEDLAQLMDRLAVGEPKLRLAA
jgi:hypothetical protein